MVMYFYSVSTEFYVVNLNHYWCCFGWQVFTSCNNLHLHRIPQEQWPHVHHAVFYGFLSVCIFVQWWSWIFQIQSFDTCNNVRAWQEAAPTLGYTNMKLTEILYPFTNLEWRGMQSQRVQKLLSLREWQWVYHGLYQHQTVAISIHIRHRLVRNFNGVLLVIPWFQEIMTFGFRNAHQTTFLLFRHHQFHHQVKLWVHL